MKRLSLFVAAGTLVCLFFSATLHAVTKREIVSASIKIADRLAAIKTVGRSWEELPFLTGTIMLAENMESEVPGSGKRFLERARLAIGAGENNLWHGDDAGYAQVALDLYRFSNNQEKEALLKLVEGPFAFAKFALRGTRDISPKEPWWVDGGYGTRFWQDDLFTMPPWLAMLCSTRDGLPGNMDACRLAHEWIEAYVFDHRPTSSDPRDYAVPTKRARGVPFLWDPKTGLFWHDPNMIGSNVFWGRGNGWAAFGLAQAAGYIDGPYSGDRYDGALSMPEVRMLLTRMAETLRTHRTPDGGWPTDLLDPSSCNEAETSATGLITFMLARGVNEGWLDRRVYAPIATEALTLLIGRIDAEGNVRGIQPPGAGPDCYAVYSDNADVNVNYGVGAVLLAAQEVYKFLRFEDLHDARRDRESSGTVQVWR